MATRTIVTFHPDVACDLCGRRLLRGEQPDVFLGGGQRRMVCELCAPRAAHEGWRRETEELATAPGSTDPQRGRSLLDRLRQSRRPSPDRAARPVRAATLAGDEASGEDEWPVVGLDWDAADGAPGDEADPGDATPLADATVNGGRGGNEPAGVGPIDADTGVKLALEVFNAGGGPRRIAGVARALGPPSVKTAAVVGPGDLVAIVVAWELCWYRYEIDLRDEPAGARLAAQGTELEELAAEDRVANAAADERGELSLLG